MKKLLIIIEAVLIQFVLMTVWSVAFGQVFPAQANLFCRYVVFADSLLSVEGAPKIPSDGEGVYSWNRFEGFETHTDMSSALDDSLKTGSGSQQQPIFRTSILNGTDVLEFENDGSGDLVDGFLQFDVGEDTLWNFLEDTSRNWSINILLNFTDVGDQIQTIFATRSGNPGTVATPGMRIVLLISTALRIDWSNGSDRFALISESGYGQQDFWKSIWAINDVAKDSVYLTVNDTLIGQDNIEEFSALGDMTDEPYLPNDGGQTNSWFLDAYVKEFSIWKDIALSAAQRDSVHCTQICDYDLSSNMPTVAGCDCNGGDGTGVSTIRRRGLRRTP